MALQVWLPLNGNLDNKGLTNYALSIVRGSETYNNAGKIGKCFHANGTNTIKISNIIPDIYNYNAYSLSAWFYIEAQNTVHTGSGIISAGNWNSQVLNLAVGGFNTDHYSGLYVSGTSWGHRYSYNFYLNTWYHAVVCSDGTKTYAYINGNLLGDGEPGFLPTNIQGNDIYIGGATYYSGMQFFGRINDVRIYDHCLSPKEVKEISKALVLNYPLDLENNPVSSLNLVANGWGGTDNWPYATSSQISTDVPSSPAGITHSYSNTVSGEYIPLIHNHSYTMSGYVKKGTATQTSCYLTLRPYDIDKNEISPKHFNFAANSTTTLTQDLKNGDTVVHLANLSSLSAWTNPPTYGMYVALFGYVSNSGYAYPDMTYTRTVCKFGTLSDKSNIDVSNNQVTLSAAYSGPTIPAGTTACMSMDGATYFYVALKSNPSDWELLTGTFTPNTKAHLKYAHYVRVMAALYAGQWTAGITLKDNDAETIIYDCSGYEHNGIVGNNSETHINSPRYDSCLNNRLTGTTYAVKSIFDFPQSSGLTIGCWIYLTTWGYQTSGLWTTSTNSTTTTSDYNTTTCAHRDGGFDMRGTNGTTYRLTCNASDVPLNTWKHVVVTHNGSDAKLYIDGVLKRSLAVPTPLVAFKSIYLGRGIARYSFGNWSDFRIYATALSEDDIKELFNTSSFICNNGSLEAYLFNENTSNLFTVENWNVHARYNQVNWADRNGELAVQLNANNFYYGANDTRNNCLTGLFKQNTQYLFDMWIDYDAVISGGTNRLGGIRIFYTDNTYSDALTGTGNSSNPMGWQHKVFYSDATKTISHLTVYYYTSTDAFYRWDSIITPVSSEINIQKSGVVNGSIFNENSDIVQIHKGGSVDSSQFIEI